MKRILDRVLGRFGYIQAKNLVVDEPRCAHNLTTDELVYMLAKNVGMYDGDIDETYEKKILNSLKDAEGFVEYLKELAARDKDRYFGAATVQEQLTIRGMFARTLWLRTKIVNANKEPVV